MRQRLAAQMSSVTYRAVWMPSMGRSRGGPSSSPSSKIEQRQRGCGIGLRALGRARYGRAHATPRAVQAAKTGMLARQQTGCCAGMAGGVRNGDPRPSTPMTGLARLA